MKGKEIAGILIGISVIIVGLALLFIVPYEISPVSETERLICDWLSIVDTVVTIACMLTGLGIINASVDW